VPLLNIQPSLVSSKAAEAKTVELLKLLPRHGDNPDITRASGEYNLTLWAPALGLFEILKALVDGGADPDYPDGNGQTPLSLAAEKGHAHTVQVLLAYGADVEVRDSVRYWKLLDWAVYAEQADVVNISRPLTPADCWT
jgi:ankyrin repeat protein